MSLLAPAWALLERALADYRDSPRAEAFLRTRLERLGGPLRLAVVGAAGTGRSTLLDAIVGERVTPRLDRLVVDWPGEVELVDAGAEHAPDADAALFALPRPDAAPPALRAAHEHPVAKEHPVAAIVVLTRADELGGGRVDAMVAARRVARRHARGAELRELCQDVLAVSGLLALGGTTLAADEFAVLRALADLPRAEVDPVLLSADRFAGPAFPLPVDPAARAALLDRFGLFGVRLATTLVRRGFADRASLAAELVRSSGVVELRTAVAECFVDRADALKARSALIALDAVLRAEPRPTPVAAELERVLANAHDLRELRLLAALRTGRLSLDLLGEDAEDEARHLLGAHGATPADRLSTTGDAYGALLRWRARALDPALPAPQRRAAAVIARSCEALITGGA